MCTTLCAENRVALVIGNSNYSTIMGKLPNPTNDAMDMTSALQELGFDVIQGIDVNKRRMTELVREFDGKLSSGDQSQNVGLFYYAGHGMEIDGSNYLIPVDANMDYQEDAQYEGISLNKIISRMKYTGNRLNMVVLDACRDNPLPKKSRSAAGGWKAYDEVAKGMFIAYGTSPGRKASDGDGRNGLFTKHLLKNIKQKGKTLEQVFKYTREGVLQESGGKQLTWSNNATIGDFYFTSEFPNLLNSNVSLTRMTDAEIKTNNDAAYEAYLNENYADSFSMYSKTANQNNVHAQAFLAYHYHQGLGVAKNYTKALEWYLKAAEHDDPTSLYNLGVLYFNGHGLPKDEKIAIEYYKKAAVLGHTIALAALEKHQTPIPKNLSEVNLNLINSDIFFNLGKSSYHHKNYTEAIITLTKAAHLGHTESQFYLSSMYHNGYGVAKNEIKAFEWDMKAAENNHVQAIFNVGRAYHHGLGVAVNYNKAMEYYQKAANHQLSVAIYGIASLYEGGLGVQADKQKALNYFKQAAKMGHQLAIDYLKKRNITDFN
ncbi:MAG: caspase family protein [Marinicella sp.]